VRSCDLLKIPKFSQRNIKNLANHNRASLLKGKIHISTNTRHEQSSSISVHGEGLQNLCVCSALMAFDQDEIFIVPLLL
jgi:hypothetical protein